MAKRAGIWPLVFNGPQDLSPILWYDFADEATVTTSGTEITAVSSKGSLGWTLSKSSTGPQYVTGINGRKCLDWGASGNHSNFMSSAASLSASIAEIYVVVDASFGGSVTGSGFAGLLTGQNGSDWYLLAAGGAITQQGTSFDSAYINGGATNRFNNLFSSPSIDNPAILRINRSTGQAFSMLDGVRIGNDRSNFSLNRGWSGLVGEYIIFSSVLSETNRQLLEAYLASKWGITLV